MENNTDYAELIRSTHEIVAKLKAMIDSNGSNIPERQRNVMSKRIENKQKIIDDMIENAKKIMNKIPDSLYKMMFEDYYLYPLKTDNAGLRSRNDIADMYGCSYSTAYNHMLKIKDDFNRLYTEMGK